MTYVTCVYLTVVYFLNLNWSPYFNIHICIYIYCVYTQCNANDSCFHWVNGWFSLLSWLQNESQMIFRVNHSHALVSLRSPFTLHSDCYHQQLPTSTIIPWLAPWMRKCQNCAAARRVRLPWRPVSLQGQRRRDPWGSMGSIGKYGYGSIPIYTIFRGMNIHLPAILMFTRGIGFWPIPILEIFGRF
jgi:hypothetical protein